MKKKIAIDVQSEVQFFSIEPLIPELKKLYDVDLVLDDYPKDTGGYHEMALGVAKFIKEKGYKVLFKDDVKDVKYDLFLAPYIDNKIKAKCYLKYEYGTLNIKPNLTFIPEVLDGFHGFLCQSTITENMLSTYGKTFFVDNLRFFNKKRTAHKNSSPKTVLFAPTYNDQESLDEITNIIKTLKTKYRVIIKSHHGTVYRKDSLEKNNILKDLADEYYDSTTNIADLILKSDVCIFDNSSAIMEAFYAEVPCAIFAHDLDMFRLGDIHPTQYQLVQSGDIPYCNNPDNILDILDEALSKENRDKQKKLSYKFLPADKRTGLKGYLDVIDFFLNSEDAHEYIMLHDHNMATKKALKFQNEQILEENKILKDKLSSYEEGKFYKLATKLYKLEGKILNIKP